MCVSYSTDKKLFNYYADDNEDLPLGAIIVSSIKAIKRREQMMIMVNDEI